MRTFYAATVSMFVLLGSAGATASEQPKTILIHAVGVDTLFASQNFSSFYDEAAKFLDYCTRQNQASGCRLLLNTDYRYHAYARHVEEDPDKYEALSRASRGAASPSAVLDELGSALDECNSGDQVALTLSAHGGPGLAESSCLAMTGLGLLCGSDLREVIEARRKPGCRVFVASLGCFSGSVTQISGPEVCTFVAADVGLPTRTLSFWGRINEESTRSGSELPLSALSDNPVTRAARFNGGGFASQVIGDQLCRDRSPTLGLEPATLRNSDQEAERLVYALRGHIEPLFGDCEVPGSVEALARSLSHVHGALYKNRLEALIAACGQEPHARTDVCGSALAFESARKRVASRYLGFDALNDYRQLVDALAERARNPQRYAHLRKRPNASSGTRSAMSMSMPSFVFGETAPNPYLQMYDDRLAEEKQRLEGEVSSKLGEMQGDPTWKTLVASLGDLDAQLCNRPADSSLEATEGSPLLEQSAMLFNEHYGQLLHALFRFTGAYDLPFSDASRDAAETCEERFVLP